MELIPPEGTPATDPSVSTVTIIDDDGTYGSIVNSL